MSEKPHGNRKKLKKAKLKIDSLVENDGYFGFIAGYTANGVPYGLTHEEMDKIRNNIKSELTKKDNLDMPF
jgi:hypothetical protein